MTTFGKRENKDLKTDMGLPQNHTLPGGMKKAPRRRTKEGEATGDHCPDTIAKPDAPGLLHEEVEFCLNYHHHH
jgi:hypothetical protein